MVCVRKFGVSAILCLGAALSPPKSHAAIYAPEEPAGVQLASFIDLQAANELPDSQQVLTSAWAAPYAPPESDGWTAHEQILAWPASFSFSAQDSDSGRMDSHWRWADSFGGGPTLPHYGGWQGWGEHGDFHCFEGSGSWPGAPAGAVPEPAAATLSLLGLTVIAFSVARGRRGALARR